MQMRCFSLLAACCAGLSAGPAPAQDAGAVDLASVQTCLGQQRESGAPVTDCVDRALADCVAAPSDAPAVASLCFRNARSGFSQGIAETMGWFRANTPEEIAAIAGIEVKYDLLASLTQCDRMEELARIRSDDGPKIQRGKDQCNAAAAGLAYIRLQLRAQTMP